MDKNKNLTAKEIFVLALGDHQKNNLVAAQKLYNQVLKIDPNHVGTHINLGMIFINLNENQKAIICSEKAIKINPNSFSAYNNLGIAFKALGEIEKAITCYERAIEINPNNAIIYNNLGKIFYQSGEYPKALSIFTKILQIDPNNIELINNLTELFSVYEISRIDNNDNNNLEKLFLFLMKKNNIFHGHITNNIIIFLLKAKNYNSKNIVFSPKTLLLKNKIIQSFLKDELLHLVLQKSYLVDIFLEKLLSELRSEILFEINEPKQNTLNKYLNFIISLAEQCWFNEYVYIQSEKENEFIKKLKDKIENSKEVNELEIAILGCYVPLNSSKIIINKLSNYESANTLFDDLINVQIREPLREKELIKSIKSLDIISDPTSNKVREQYEQNPYPRWRYTKSHLSHNFLASLNHEIKPNKVKHSNKFKNPNILIAGCGTGSHTILTTRYKNAKILGVDLSTASLAYAKRKSEELNIENIEYLQADILQLKKLNINFDVIESAGAIQTMQDPIAGLKVLLDILEPHGFLRLGLYSKIARQPVVEIREFIKDNDKDIRSLRELVVKEKKDQLFRDSRDFYSTSGVRDLLFHVKEHRFTIPEIKKVLKDLNLEFLGFNFENPKIKSNFSKYFPNDKKNISLDNWHQFELSNPYTFDIMYQFWVRKIQ